jgi:hypothetical protein
MRNDHQNTEKGRYATWKNKGRGENRGGFGKFYIVDA